MTFTQRCTKCNWISKPKQDQFTANQALHMHNNRKHGGMKTWNQTGSAAPQPAKRKYAKRIKEPARPELSATINFCPGCGFDLHRVAVGMVLAERTKQV